MILMAIVLLFVLVMIGMFITMNLKKGDQGNRP
jgi:uncharacterized protein YneF (UPF0154 family)